MGLETGTYVDDLVNTNPVATDLKSQGDDHLRLIKTTLQNTFPNASKAFRFPVYAAKTSDYTVLSSDQGKLIGIDATSGNVALTLPTLGASDDGWNFTAVALNVTNTAQLTATINGASNLVLTKQYQFVFVWWSGTAWYAAGGTILSSTGEVSIDDLNVVNLTVSGLLDISSVTDRMKLPNGTTAQRPGSPAEGDFRYNSDLEQLEFYDSGPTVRQVPLAQPISAGFKNLVVKNNATTPTTKVDVDADAVTVETSSGVAYRRTSVNLTIDCGTTGANGLDTGGLAINTLYAVFVIYNPSTDTTAGLMSTSPTAPTLPSGYTAFARIGWVPTNGSALFYNFEQLGRFFRFTDWILIAQGVNGSNPNATTTPLGTFASTSIAAVVPSTVESMSFRVSTTYNNNSTSQFALAPDSSYGGYSSTTKPAFGADSNSRKVLYFTMEYGASIYYVGTTGGFALWHHGWRDNI